MIISSRDSFNLTSPKSKINTLELAKHQSGKTATSDLQIQYNLFNPIPGNSNVNYSEHSREHLI